MIYRVMNNMKKAAKFKRNLIIEIAFILAYRFIDIEGVPLINPFYLLSMIFGIYIVGNIFGYSCPKCSKNQIFRGFYSYRLPTDQCWNCNEEIDKN